MTRSILIDGTERAGITRVESIRITNSAGGNGEAGLGELILDDVAGTLVDSGTRPDLKKTWVVTEDETASPTVLGFGRIGNYETQRHNPQSPSDRQVDWKLFLEGPTIELYGFDVHGQTRPVETDVQRFEWVCSTYLNGSPRASTDLDYTTLAPNTNTVLMDSKTYNNSDVAEVIRDCAEVSHKLFFVNTKGQIFYDLKDSTAYTSSISISDRIADIDQETVFYAIWDQGPALTWEGQSYASRLRMAYANDGSVLVTNPTSEAAHDYWVDRVFDSEVQSADRAAAIAANELGFRARGVRTYSLSLLMANDQVDLIEIGQRIQIKARAAVDADNAYVYRRIANLQWEVESPEYYLAHLQLDQPLTAHAVPARGRPSTSIASGAPSCDDTEPVTFALGVDGAGWTKFNTPGNPDGLGRYLGYESLNVSASGDSVIISHGDEQRFEEEFLPGTFYSYYTGALVTKDSYSPADAEEMLFRFNWMELGNYDRPIYLSNTPVSQEGVELWPPRSVGTFPTSESDGELSYFGGTPVEYAWEVGQSYYVRTIRGGGAVKVWKVEEIEPDWMVTDGATGLAGGLSFRNEPVSNALYHDADYTPSAIEIESLTVFQLVNDPNCFDYGDLPHSSGYYVPSDTIQAIKDTIVTDHGALTGLADDDHTQYIKDSEFGAKGRILVGSGSGTFDDLPVGSNGDALVADSTQTLGVKWDTVAGGSGPFEDYDTFIWNFISPANQLTSTDLTAGMGLSSGEAFIGVGTTYLYVVGGKIYTVSDYGLVLQDLSSDPGGGDSEQGQVYYNSTSDKIRWYNGSVWADIGGGHTHVYSEVPSGTVNGSNATFTLAATPTSGTLRLYKNGLRQKAGAGNDYTLATNTITFLTGNIPQTGDNLLADYE